MWISKEVVGWFTSMRNVAETNAMVSIEAIQQYREQLAAVIAERDALKAQILTAQNNAEWLRMRVNALEMERAKLMEKAYNIQLPVPELARAITTTLPFDARAFSFDDVGDQRARELGLPVYDDKK